MSNDTVKVDSVIQFVATVVITAVLTCFLTWVITISNCVNEREERDKVREQERMAIVRGFGEYDPTPPHAFRWKEPPDAND